MGHVLGLRTVLPVADRVADRVPRFLYALQADYPTKIHTIATQLYGARAVAYAPAAARELAELDVRHPGLAVCVAKTPDSFSDDPAAGGLARDFVPTVTEVALARGAGFVIARMGPIATMPGLPREPSALRMHVDADGVLHVDES